MTVNIGIKWLMIIGLSALCLDSSLSNPTNVGVVVDDAFLNEFLSEISIVEKEYIRMAYQIQHNAAPILSSTTIDILFEPVSVCMDFEYEHKKIWDIVEDRDPVDPPITIIRSSNCSVLEKSKMKIIELKNDLKRLVKKQAFSVQYKELKAKYAERFNHVQKEINEAFHHASDEEKTKYGNLPMQLQAQEDRIDIILHKVEDKQKKKNDASIPQCVKEIIDDHIDAALETYRKISDKTSIKEIIEAAYQNEDSFSRLVNFIGRTDSSISFLHGYTALYDKMESNGHKKGINLLILTTAVAKPAAKWEEFSKLLERLEESLKAWHEVGNYVDFIKYAGENTGDKNYEFANGILRTFIRTAYNNDSSNIEKILDLRFKMDKFQKLLLLNELITEMKFRSHTSKPEFFIVINDVINQRRDGLKEGNMGREIISLLDENVPKSIRAVMFKNLCFRNALYKEYMVAGDLAHYARRNIYTTILTENIEAATFEFMFLDRGRKLLIENRQYRQQLFAYDGESPRNVYASTQGSLVADNRAYFMIEIVDDAYVRIKNLKYNEYMYPASERTKDTKFRPVYSSSEASSSSLWELSLCHLPI